MWIHDQQKISVLPYPLTKESKPSIIQDQFYFSLPQFHFVENKKAPDPRFCTNADQTVRQLLVSCTTSSSLFSGLTLLHGITPLPPTFQE